MPEGYLLDTVAASALLRRHPGILSVLRGEAIVYLPIVAVAELRYGALRAQHPDRQGPRVEALVGQCRLIDCDEGTAGHFAQIKARLARAGEMIPVNDLWIAANALQYGLPVVTVDAHFARVPGVQVIGW